MKRPAIFFDRDNTLIVSDGYLGDPERVVLMPHAADAIARGRQMGFAIVTFSNQSGVARGLFDEDAVHDVNTRMEQLLQEANPQALIDRHEFCPFHPRGTIEQYRQESELRKPRPGMILNAAEALALDLAQSWVIGDAGRDIEAGHRAGCRTILFQPKNVPQSPAAEESLKSNPEHVVSTLSEALDYVERARHSPPPKASTVDAPVARVLGQKPAPVSAEAPPTPRLTVPVVKRAVTVVAEPVATAVATEEPMESIESQPKSTPEPPTPPPAPKVEEPPKPAVAATPAPAPISTPAPVVSHGHTDLLLEQILQEMRRGDQHDANDFSVSKLLAGITQMIAVAILAVAYFRGGASLQTTLLLAIFVQTLTIALLIMSRQK